jgi:hypothetical protein
MSSNDVQVHTHRAPNVVPPPPQPTFPKFDNMFSFAPSNFMTPQNVLLNFKVINTPLNANKVDKQSLPEVQKLFHTNKLKNVQPAKPKLLYKCRIVLYGRDFENLQKDLIETIKEYGGVPYSGICSLKTNGITHLITTENAYNSIPVSTRAWLQSTKIKVVNEKWLVDSVQRHSIQDENNYRLTQSFVPLIPMPVDSIQTVQAPITPTPSISVMPLQPIQPPSQNISTPKTVNKRKAPSTVEGQPEKKKPRDVAPRASAKKFYESRCWAKDDLEEEFYSEEEEEQDEEEEIEVELDAKDEKATYVLLDLFSQISDDENLTNESGKKKSISSNIDIRTHGKKRKKKSRPDEIVKWTIEETIDWVREALVVDEQTLRQVEEWITKEMIDGEALLELDSMDKLKYTNLALGVKLKIKKAVCTLKE